jgi:peptide/nickel transport system permease protein
MIITAVVGIVGGILSAKFADRGLDKVIKITYISSTAAPPFMIPLILLLIFASLLHAFPTSGAIGSLIPLPSPIVGIPMIDAILEGNWSSFLSLFQHAILPSFAIALVLYGFLTRVLSSSIIEIMGSNFVKAARARGISENRLLFQYGLKNSLVQVITLLALILTFALVIDVFVENIFSYPGLGQFAVEATQSFDYPGILATTVVYATIIVIVNLVADLLYFVVDPRVRHA